MYSAPTDKIMYEKNLSFEGVEITQQLIFLSLQYFVT